MATMRNIVERSLRKIRVTAADDPVTAVDMSDGLEALNSMLHALKTFGVDITHTDKTEIEAFPMAAEFEEGAVYLLAERLSPDYGAPAGAVKAWLQGMQAAYMTIEPVTMPSAIMRTSSQDWRT